MVLLICFVVTVTVAPSWSADQSKVKGLFFSYSTAQKLYGDLKYQRENAAASGKLLTLAGADIKLLEHQTVEQEKKIAGLELDKSSYRQESDRFQALYVQADKDKVEAENAAPSRLRWFGAGVATAITVVLTLFILK